MFVHPLLQIMNQSSRIRYRVNFCGFASTSAGSVIVRTLHIGRIEVWLRDREELGHANESLVPLLDQLNHYGIYIGVRGSCPIYNLHHLL